MRHEFFHGGRLRAFDDDATALKAGMFFRAALHKDDQLAKAWCSKNGVVLEKAQAETAGTAGGFLVPPEVEAGIIKIRTLAGTFRRNANVKRMGTDSRSFPRLDTGLTAVFVGENSQIAEQERSWIAVNLNAKKAAALPRMSSELGEDETVDIGNDFAEDAAYALAALEDSSGWNGDGTSPYGGITGVDVKLIDGTHTASVITAPGSAHDTFDELDAADLAALIALYPEYVLPSAKWYCSSYAVSRTFARLGATAAGMTMTASGQRPMMQYLSWPIEPIPSLPGAGDQSGKVMLAFGDLSMAAMLGERRGVTIQTTQERYLEYDQIGCRATKRAVAF